MLSLNIEYFHLYFHSGGKMVKIGEYYQLDDHLNLSDSNKIIWRGESHSHNSCSVQVFFSLPFLVMQPHAIHTKCRSTTENHMLCRPLNAKMSKPDNYLIEKSKTEVILLV